MQCFVQDEPVLFRTSFVDTRIGQFEYTYPGTEKEALAAGEVRVKDGGDYTVREFRKDGTSLSFVLDAPEGGKYVEVPLLYYPGYRAEVDGFDHCRVSKGVNNQVRLMAIQSGENIQYRVWYESPLSWRIAEAVSLLGFVTLLFFLVREKRRAG